MKKFTRLSLMLALSVVLNLIESVIPIFSGYIPGLKLGLANIIIIVVLYKYTFKEVLYISVLRVFLVGILRTGIFSVAFFFSLGGALLSAVIMIIFKKFSKLSIIGISIMGSLFHSIGQILVSIIIIENTSMIYLLPWLLLFSIPTGIITGLIGKNFIKNIDFIATEENGYY